MRGPIGLPSRFETSRKSSSPIIEGMDAATTYKCCVDGLRAFVAGAGFEDAVIGLSGGIDSSLVAVMAVDALGAQHVHGVMLPGPYSSEDSLEDARQLASNVGMPTFTMPIVGPYEAFAHVISEATGETLNGLAAENTQARCRMVCIMALSNAYGWMMLNTGNKSEAAMGYSTLYGDTAGAFAPIGGLYKTEVFALSRWRNEDAIARGEVPPIPENVLVKPPSAELAPDQSDEASLGIDYETLDAILIGLNEQGKSVGELVGAGYPQSQVSMVANRYDAYAFKRAMEPPFADVSR